MKIIGELVYDGGGHHRARIIINDMSLAPLLKKFDGFEVAITVRRTRKPRRAK